MRVFIWGFVVVWLGMSAAHSYILAQDENREEQTERRKNERPPIKRASRPTFSDLDVDLLFFKDAFADGLVGDRPTDFGAFATNNTGNGGGNEGTGTGETGGGGATYTWSKVISADAIESEVKRLNGVIDQVVTTPRKFESGGYREARIHFTMLSMLFAVIAEYDGDVKWKENGIAGRELFSAMARNATAGSSNVYQQAKLRKEDLRELVNGGSLEVSGDVDPATDWPYIVDRPPLMTRLEYGYEDRIKPFISSNGDFSSNKDELLVEAYMIATMSEVLALEGMPDAEEEGYTDYAVEMRDAALEIVAAINADDYDRAATAGSLVFQTCQNCHGDWQ